MPLLRSCRATQAFPQAGKGHLPASATRGGFGWHKHSKRLGRLYVFSSCVLEIVSKTRFRWLEALPKRSNVLGVRFTKIMAAYGKHFFGDPQKFETPFLVSSKFVCQTHSKPLWCFPKQRIRADPEPLVEPSSPHVSPLWRQRPMCTTPQNIMSFRLFERKIWHKTKHLVFHLECLLNIYQEKHVFEKTWHLTLRLPSQLCTSLIRWSSNKGNTVFTLMRLDHQAWIISQTSEHRAESG